MFLMSWKCGWWKKQVQTMEGLESYTLELCYYQSSIADCQAVTETISRARVRLHWPSKISSQIIST